jgi:hypothetical protein
MEVAPEPGSTEVVLARPTMADRLAAARALADKVLPDLKSISGTDGGNLVTLMLNLSPSTGVKLIGENPTPP